MNLANTIRPTNINNIVGQHHLLDKNKPLRNIIDSNQLVNMIFFGPPGTGKTTLARLIANNSHVKIKELNGTSLKISDIKKVIDESENEKILLYIDEIQYLNKKQQQSILEFIENGQITLIASTTENPYFSIYNAILSRSHVFEFKHIKEEDIVIALRRTCDYIIEKQNITFKPLNIDNCLELIAKLSGGDVRKSINLLELLTIGKNSEVVTLSKSKIKDILSASNISFDDDLKFNLMSALQKSIRGSDADAAVFYLAKILSLNDLILPCRRLLSIATEDIGLAVPNAITMVKSCVDSAKELGLPEARIPLAQAVIFLATCPKSNSAYMAINKAMNDIKFDKGKNIPRHLQNTHFDGEGNDIIGQKYLYPHEYPNHYVKQQYLPDDIKNIKYYEYGTNKQESITKEYWNKIKNIKE